MTELRRLNIRCCCKPSNCYGSVLVPEACDTVTLSNGQEEREFKVRVATLAERERVTGHLVYAREDAIDSNHLEFEWFRTIKGFGPMVPIRFERGYEPDGSSGLQVRLEKMKAERQIALDQQKEAQRTVASLEGKIANMTAEIAAFKGAAREPMVTEHAYLRYFERVCGFDLEAIRQAMLDEQTLALIRFQPSGKFPKDGYRLVVKDGDVVTVET